MKRLIIATILTTLMTPVYATSMNEMTFTWIRDCESCTPKILAKGTITEDTPKFFEQIITDKPNTEIFLDSVGGSMVGGTELGKLFNKHKVDVYVAPSVTYYTILGDKTVSNMKCYSACAYAFLGGQNRLVEDGGLYGVHSHRSVSTKENSMVGNQLIQNFLLTYLEQVNITKKYLEIANSVASDDMKILTQEEMHELKITTTRG